MNEKKELTLFSFYLRLIQGKRRFKCTVSKDPHFRMIEDDIPPGIEETGGLLFEPLDNSQDPIRIHIKMVVEGTGYFDVDFDGIDISK